jgi:hypothetical protein
MTKDLPSFQRYQQEFTAHLRDPLHQPRPKDVSAKRMAVYEEVVFNNLFESISACFPVAQNVLGKRAWLKLCKDFLREHSARSPIFRQIPEEFINYLTSINLSDQANPATAKLPPYLLSLCHYEWVELAVAYQPAPSSSGLHGISITEDLLEYQPVFTPVMQLLNYDYAVQKISPRYKPKEKVSTQLLVYRDIEDAVKFVELNPVTYRLIELLQQQATTCKQALTMIANELQHIQPESVTQFGLEILNDLRKQGVIVGIHRVRDDASKVPAID